MITVIRANDGNLWTFICDSVDGCSKTFCSASETLDNAIERATISGWYCNPKQMRAFCSYECGDRSGWPTFKDPAPVVSKIPRFR